MAVLRSKKREVKVPCRCLIGRSAVADIRLESRRASSEHASLGWYGGRWILRDLCSSNGTSVNGRVLSVRERITLSASHELGFGDDEEVWTLVDASPPEPCAVLLGPQRFFWGQQNLLLLQSSEAPEASVFLDGAHWRIDDGASVGSPECGDIVSLPSGYYRLLLPEESAREARTAGPELDLLQIQLTFRVSPERLVLVLEQGSTQLQLPSRAYLQTLLLLARIRLGHQTHDSEAGWISAAELAELRGSTQEKINVDIHRLRKLLQEAGVQNAAQIVERDDAKRVRIGIARIKEERG